MIMNLSGRPKGLFQRPYVLMPKPVQSLLPKANAEPITQCKTGNLSPGLVPSGTTTFKNKQSSVPQVEPLRSGNGMPIVPDETQSVCQEDGNDGGMSKNLLREIGAHKLDWMYNNASSQCRDSQRDRFQLDGTLGTTETLSDDGSKHFS